MDLIDGLVAPNLYFQQFSSKYNWLLGVVP